MKNKYFSLSYLKYLQEKYKNAFLLTSDNILVLPPIIKEKTKNRPMLFPVSKKFSQNKISRPIGIILVNFNDKEIVYDLKNYEFTTYSQDFNIEYDYYLDKQEDIKFVLQNLYIIYSINSSVSKKNKFDDYYKSLRKLFSQDFFNFYTDLINNDIIPLTIEIKNNRKLFNPQLSQNVPNNNFSNQLKKDLSMFIRKEILKDENSNSLTKISFFIKFGNFIKGLRDYDKDYQNYLKKTKFEIIKIYALNQNEYFNYSIEEEFISKILIMMLNTLLIRKIKKQKIDKYEQSYFYASSIYDDEIDKISNSTNKKLLENIHKELEKDEKKSYNENCSDILSAYYYIMSN